MIEYQVIHLKEFLCGVCLGEKEKNIDKSTLFSNVPTVFEGIVVIPGQWSRAADPKSRIMVRGMTAIPIFFFYIE